MNRLDWDTEVTECNDTIVESHTAYYELISQRITLMQLRFNVTTTTYINIGEKTISAELTSTAQDVADRILLYPTCKDIEEGKQICEDWLAAALNDIRFQIYRGGK
jgi:hypothetical protein